VRLLALKLERHEPMHEATFKDDLRRFALDHDSTMQHKPQWIIGYLATLVLFLGLAAVAGGQTIYVDNRSGSDTFDGQRPAPAGDGVSGPVATIAHALTRVPVGGRIMLARTGLDYREEVLIKGLRKGRAATPLVLDGNGATVSGLVVVPPERWALHAEDVYYFENKIGDDPPQYGKMPVRNHLKEPPRYFLVNSNAAPHAATLEAIEPGGFFYDTRGKPPRIYFRLPAGVAMSACAIELPISGGVFVADDDYVVVRNLRSQYAWNDGFAGFWGIGVVFENCHAVYNCDEGISLHGTSSTIIDGGLVENTFGHGIADVMSCLTLYRNVVIRNNQNAGVLFQGAGHGMQNCTIYGNVGTQILADGDGCIALDNCLILADARQGAVAIRMHRGQINHCTISGGQVGLAVSQGGWMRNSIVAGCAKALVEQDPSAVSTFNMRRNFFATGVIVRGSETLTRETWGDQTRNSKTLTECSWHDGLWTDGRYAITPDSPLFKAGEYGRTPGAVLPQYKGWNPDEKEVFVRPPP
jgi:hypothetical protein